MIYLDNIIFSLQRHGGVSVLWGNLIEALVAEGADARFIDFRNASDNKVRKDLSIPQKMLIERADRPVVLERFRDVRIKNPEKFVFHSSHYRICPEENAINVTTLHDFTYEFFFKGIQKKVHIWQKYNAIRKADVVVCISENTRRDLLRFLPDISEDKIRVIYNGVSDDYYPLQDSLPDLSDFLLFVGGRQSYKNFAFAVACAKEVGKRLLVAGSPLTDKEMQLVIKELGPEGYRNVVHPDNTTLNELYNSVSCLIYPSLYEGFGIPVVEAQKAGCPVIAMGRSSIPEITGSGGLLLDNASADEFSCKFKRLQTERDELRNAGFDNSRRFSWSKMTAQYIDLYNEFLS